MALATTLCSLKLDATSVNIAVVLNIRTPFPMDLKSRKPMTSWNGHKRAVMRWGSKWFQNAFIMLLKIADSVEWNPQISLISCYWYLNYVFPFVIIFAVIFSTVCGTRLKHPIKKSDEKKYRIATTTEFWYAFIQADQCTVQTFNVTTHAWSKSFLTK